MTILEKVSAERNENKPKNLIRFYQEGTWYRAYEMSAYLAHFFPNGLEEGARLTPTRRTNKESYDTINVGIQLDKMQKFFPSVTPTMHEGYVDISVDLSKYGIDANNIKSLFEAWKSSMPVKGKAETKNNVPQYLAKPMTFTAIIKAVITFQLESKTPEETYKFVRELKDMVAALI